MSRVEFIVTLFDVKAAVDHLLATVMCHCPVVELIVTQSL